MASEPGPMSDHNNDSRDWNQAYQTGQTPWDTGQVDGRLLRAVEDGILPLGRLLEIGCGTGTNARFLASRGFDVTAVDLSPIAIEKASSHQSPSGLRYLCLDILKDPLPEGPYDTVFDRGCFHMFSEPEAKRLFAEKVAAVLNVGGCWLSMIGSTEGDPREAGPPRRTAADVVATVEPYLEIVSLQATVLSDVPNGPTAWQALFRRRLQPAQPATT